MLAAYLAAYFASTLFFQMKSPIAPGTPGAPIDYFTGGQLWLLSFVALLTALKHAWLTRGFLFWLLSCAGLAILAIDEVFEQHERTRRFIGDDDYFKIAAWLAAGLALYVVARLERPSMLNLWAIGAGYVFHSLYIVVDVGDGDLFTLPLLPDLARLWLEELLEMTFLACYLFAFTSFLPLAYSPGQPRSDTRGF